VGNKWVGGDTLSEKTTVCFDFDGVIHSYVTGWHGVTAAWDPPVVGINEIIQALRKDGYRVVVHSARCHQRGGIETIKNYLKRHNIVVDDVVDHKPIAMVTVDDRVICFDPKDLHTLLDRIKSFKPWNKE